MDEASSSVDQDTDRAMQTVIKEEFENYTIIMVSHRLKMVIDFDTVVVIEKGSVVPSEILGLWLIRMGVGLRSCGWLGITPEAGVRTILN